MYCAPVANVERIALILCSADARCKLDVRVTQANCPALVCARMLRNVCVGEECSSRARLAGLITHHMMCMHVAPVRAMHCRGCARAGFVVVACVVSARAVERMR